LREERLKFQSKWLIGIKMVVMRLATVYAIAATVVLERNLVWEELKRKEVESC
jgi:hypothetical protein